MRPVLSAAEMGAVDAATQEHTPITTLIERAGTAVAHVALVMLGGGYGRRSVVVGGKGHNGDDGRVAAGLLARRGVRVLQVAPGPDAGAATARLSPGDLVVDAAFGTGFRGEYEPPSVPAGVGVLAVDIPSGLSADLGTGSGAVRADATVTFGALKPGLILADGPLCAGAVVIESIGLELGAVSMWHVEDADVTDLVSDAPREAHKWQRAVYVVAGSPGMGGAAILSATAAARTGAGMVRLGSPGASIETTRVTEAVARLLPAEGFADAVLEELERCQALVVGPGLGQHPGNQDAVRRLLAASPVPVVLDADGLNALGKIDSGGLGERRAPLVLTPHDGEFARLAGGPPGADRVAAVRELARRARAVVLLKGSTTIVADAGGEVRFVTSGSSRLATAGTGDVLSGVIGALLARGLAPLDAASLGAHVHGRAAQEGRRQGLVASDLPALVSDVLSELVAP